MSELKAYRVKGVTLGDTHDVYLKSEADKVIAELKARIAELEEESRWRKCCEEMPKLEEGVGSEGGKMKSCYFGRKRWYDADEVDKILAELRENNKKAFERDAENWNRLCVKYNKLIELKNDFCEKFKDIELEIDK